MVSVGVLVMLSVGTGVALRGGGKGMGETVEEGLGMSRLGVDVCAGGLRMEVVAGLQP